MFVQNMGMKGFTTLLSHYTLNGFIIESTIYNLEIKNFNHIA